MKVNHLSNKEVSYSLLCLKLREKFSDLMTSSLLHRSSEFLVSLSSTELCLHWSSIIEAKENDVSFGNISKCDILLRSHGECVYLVALKMVGAPVQFYFLGGVWGVVGGKNLLEYVVGGEEAERGGTTM